MPEGRFSHALTRDCLNLLPGASRWGATGIWSLASTFPGLQGGEALRLLGQAPKHESVSGRGLCCSISMGI